MLFMPSEEFFKPRAFCQHHCCPTRPSLSPTDIFMDDPFFQTFKQQQPRLLQRQVSVNDLIERVGKLIGEEDLIQKLAIQRVTREKTTTETTNVQQQQQQQQLENKAITIPELMDRITDSVMTRHRSRCCQTAQSMAEDTSETKENTTVTTSENNTATISENGNTHLTFKDWLDQFSSAIQQEFNQSIFGESKDSEISTNCSKDLVIKDDSKNFRVTIKTGDFKPEEIEVKVKDGYVSVLAQRAEKSETEGMSRSHSQRLERMVKLPSYIDAEAVIAELKNGLLTILAAKESQKEHPVERIVNIKRLSLEQDSPAEIHRSEIIIPLPLQDVD